MSGSKNASLPILVCCLLTDAPLLVTNVPNISDVKELTNLLRDLGVCVDLKAEQGEVLLQAKDIDGDLNFESARRIRASVWLLGPLAARTGIAIAPMPGGCALNNSQRKVDMHLAVLEAMGARADICKEQIIVSAPTGLKGANFRFQNVSVGATITALLSAAIAKGATCLGNCAKEPEIVDLCKVLSKMGVEIDGVGTGDLTIQGSKPNGTSYRVMPDRIEALTYFAAAWSTEGKIHVKGVQWEHIASLVPILKGAGVELELKSDGITSYKTSTIKPVHVSTAPYPGFPTDFQPIFASVLCKADGESSVQENLYDNRFLYANELAKLGANITVRDRKAYISGVESLKNGQVQAHDIRCGAALVVAALSAKGESLIDRAEKIDRGYQNIENKLRSCGARVERI